MTKLEKVLKSGKFDADELITFGCPMDFGMKADTSLCPTGCKRCWNEECEESQKSIVSFGQWR